MDVPRLCHGTGGERRGAQGNEQWEPSGIGLEAGTLGVGRRKELAKSGRRERLVCFVGI